VAAAAAIAAIVAVTNTANGFLLFGCERVGVPEAFRLPWLLPDVSVTGLSALPGVISVTIYVTNGNAAWGTVAWTATSSSFRCMGYVAFTCKWNSAFSAACTCLGIRESISSIDISERDVIVMIGGYWYSRVLLSSFMILWVHL
jgi:hypothetical protein